MQNNISLTKKSHLMGYLGIVCNNHSLKQFVHAQFQNK